MKRGINIFVIIIGLVLILNSSVMGITGYIVNESIKISGSVLGFVFLIGGLVLFILREREYEEIAPMIYEKLAIKGAYGHHTENIEDLKKSVSGGWIFPKEVGEVIKKEIQKGHLHSVKGSSVSLKMNPAVLEEIIKKHGDKMPKEVKERMDDLIERKVMEGVR